MNELDFAQRMLTQYYEDPVQIRKNDGATLVRYRHTATGNNLLVIESTNTNDGVYQALQNHSKSRSKSAILWLALRSGNRCPRYPSGGGSPKDG